MTKVCACPPLRLFGRKCRHVEAQTVKAKEALQAAKEALEKLSASQLASLRRERDEYRAIIDALLGKHARSNGEDNIRERLRAKVAQRREEEHSRPAEPVKALPLPM